MPLILALPMRLLHGSVTIKRDHFGAAHIYADTVHELFTDMGMLPRKIGLFQLEMLKRTATGRVSEVLGSKYLDVDRTVVQRLRPGLDPTSAPIALEPAPRTAIYSRESPPASTRASRTSRTSIRTGCPKNSVSTGLHPALGMPSMSPCSGSVPWLTGIPTSTWNCRMPGSCNLWKKCTTGRRPGKSSINYVGSTIRRR